MLSNFTRLSIPSITGTVLSITSVSSFAGASTYYYYERVDLRLAVLVGMSGVGSARMGVMLSAFVSAATLRRTIGFVCLAMSPIVAFRERKASPALDSQLPLTDRISSASNSTVAFVRENAAFAAVGALAGLCQGLLGIGGGLVQCVALSSMGSLPQCEVIGTCLASTFIINTSAAIFYARKGKVHGRAVILIALSGVVSSVAATVLALDLDDSVLRKWIAAMMAMSSIGMMR